jgi:phage host-nuclease inhibitor protein Gam
MPTKKKEAVKSQPRKLTMCKSQSDLTEFVGQVGQLRRERDRIASEIQDRISVLEDELKEAVIPMDEQIQQLANAIKGYVDDNRESLFPSDGKTLKLITGTISFRKLAASVKTRMSQKVLEKILASHNLLEFYHKATEKFASVYLRLKVELNKDQILADPLTAKKKIGVEISDETERMYIKPNELDSEIEAWEEAA